MSTFISLNVFAPEDFALKKRLLMFEKGTNVLNTVVVGSVDDLLQEIADAGGRVISCDRLDEFEPVTPPEMTARDRAVFLLEEESEDS